MRNKKYGRHFFCLCIALLLAFGLFSNQVMIASGKNRHPLRGFTWDTTGGGSMKFEVKPSGNNYEVFVKSYYFKNRNAKLLLTPSDNAYAKVRGIFLGSIDLSQTTFTPQGLTGTWTSITVEYRNGKLQKIDNIRAFDLAEISNFVESNVDKPKIDKPKQVITPVAK